MALDALAKLMNESAATDTTTGTWFDLQTREPFGGIPLDIRISGGVASSSTKTITLAIQGGTDGSTSAATLFSKAYSITTTAASNHFEEIAEIVSSYRYVRAVATFSAAITTGTELVVGFTHAAQI